MIIINAEDVFARFYTYENEFNRHPLVHRVHWQYSVHLATFTSMYLKTNQQATSHWLRKYIFLTTLVNQPPSTMTNNKSPNKIQV